MENENKPIEGREPKRERRRLIRDMLYGNPQSKALSMMIVEAKLGMVDAHEQRIQDLENRFKVKSNRIVDKVEGTYYYYGNPIEIRNKDTDYFNVFDVVFELMPNGGQKSYADIETALRKRSVRGKKIHALTNTKRDRRIRMNLTSTGNGFFRYAKNIENTSTLGHPLIDTQMGKGIIFNNLV
jgi:ribosome-associated translation inhibitor RaiA